MKTALKKSSISFESYSASKPSNLYLLAALTLAILLFGYLFAQVAAQTYTVDAEKSELTWVGRKVAGSHTGTLELSSGNLIFEKEQLKGGEFVLDMTTIKDNDLEGKWAAKLEGHLKSEDFFNVETFPTATLKLKKITNVKGAGIFTLTADLTIKGITNEISFDAQITTKDKQLNATASLVVDRSKYDVRYGSPSFFNDIGDKAIDDEFTVDVKLVANK